MREDDEYDFGAPAKLKKSYQAPKAQQPLPRTGTEPVREPDLFNPHKFSLVPVQMKRQASQSLGFGVSYVATGVFNVVKVVEGEAAAKLGVEKHMYLLSVDGKRIGSENELKDIEKSNRRLLRMTFAKRRPSQLQPDSFTLPSQIQRQSGYQYFLVRINPTNGTRVGTGIGERDGKVYVTQVVEGSAGQKAGVQVGDRILAVDDVRIENREKCKTLVQQSMGNPLDMVLERAPPKPAPPPPPPPPPPDPDAGDPTAGVPSIPDDVSMIMDTKVKKTLGSIRQKPRKKKGKSTKSVRSVTISKNVESTKLHQQKK